MPRKLKKAKSLRIPAPDRATQKKTSHSTLTTLTKPVVMPPVTPVHVPAKPITEKRKRKGSFLGILLVLVLLLAGGAAYVFTTHLNILAQDPSLLITLGLVVFLVIIVLLFFFTRPKKEKPKPETKSIPPPPNQRRNAALFLILLGICGSVAAYFIFPIALIALPALITVAGVVLFIKALPPRAVHEPLSLPSEREQLSAEQQSLVKGINVAPQRTAEDAQVTISEKSLQSKEFETDLDRLYTVLRQKKVLHLPDIILFFKISQHQAEYWAKVLEEHDLVKIKYSASGQIELHLPEEKR
ncbi:hypothetical protein J4464_01530 [Candidatus Woesearchaeota archaeon]|nr:hypothetical protein [Candidatus Woesearchaeota archaeon]